MEAINTKRQALVLVLSVALYFDVVQSFIVLPSNHQRITTFRGKKSNSHVLRAGASDDDDTDDDDDEYTTEDRKSIAVNVLGTALQPCCTDVGGSGIGTGFYRDGYCATGEQDLGRHTVCCQVTDEFLEFSASVGNDLSTPAPHYYFPGLKGGDIWCLCAQRWAQAYNAGMAPKIFLQSTHEKTLNYAPFEILREYAIDKEDADRLLDDLNAQRERLNKLL